jgi:hypothetical protein
MRPEIFDTFERYSTPKAEKLPRIGLDEIKESINFFAGLTMEIIRASNEIAEKDGLKVLIKEAKSLKNWRPNMLIK